MPNSLTTDQIWPAPAPLVPLADDRRGSPAEFYRGASQLDAYSGIEHPRAWADLLKSILMSGTNET